MSSSNNSTTSASLEGTLTPAQQGSLDATLAEVAKIKKLTPADADKTDLLFYAPPSYWLDLHTHDPLAIAKTLKQPMLILQGGRDYQVTQADFDLWKQALGTQPRVTLKLYPRPQPPLHAPAKAKANPPNTIPPPTWTNPSSRTSPIGSPTSPPHDPSPPPHPSARNPIRSRTPLTQPRKSRGF